MSISINVIGTMSIFRNGEVLSLPKSKRTRALLAYLLIANRPHRRERLCEVFWESPSDVKGALRWSLSKVRALVNELDNQRIMADSERVILQSEDILVDIREIEKELKDTNIPSHKLKTILQKLDEPLLCGLDLPDQKIYQQWLVAERNEIENLYCEVLSKLSVHWELSLTEQLNWNKIYLNKNPYNTQMAKLLLSKLKMLNLTSDYDNLSDELAMRFRKAAIKWDVNDVKHGAKKAIQCDLPKLQREILLQQEVQFCTVDDDIKLAYASIGQGYPIIKTANWLSHLEHDWQAPIWSLLYHDLAQKYRFIRYDERGNGLSDWNVKDISFDAFSKDLEAIVSATKLKKFALLGISQGASVAIDYAIKYPEKVSHLILFGAYAAGWRINATDEEIKKREAIMTLTGIGWGKDNPAYRQIFSSTFLPSANKEEYDWFNDFQRLTTSPENAERFLSVFGDIDVRHHLANIKVPTLIIHSLNDQRIPVDVAKEMAASIPNAELIILNSDGHLLLGREPAAKDFVDAVKEFINR